MRRRRARWDLDPACCRQAQRQVAAPGRRPQRPGAKGRKRETRTRKRVR
jgi:hypothetical protein